MARFRVIVLDSPDAQQAARANYRVALWADVPASRQPFYAAQAGPEATSAWLGAQAGDINALRNGSVVEQVVMYHPDTTKTVVQMETDVAALWTAFQARINNVNIWANYGSTWDGTTWSIASVA